jgi:hypothetical protein
MPGEPRASRVGRESFAAHPEVNVVRGRFEGLPCLGVPHRVRLARVSAV